MVWIVLAFCFCAVFVELGCVAARRCVGTRLDRCNWSGLAGPFTSRPASRPRRHPVARWGRRRSGCSATTGGGVGAAAHHLGTRVSADPPRRESDIRAGLASSSRAWANCVCLGRVWLFPYWNVREGLGYVRDLAAFCSTVANSLAAGPEHSHGRRLHLGSVRMRFCTVQLQGRSLCG